MDEPYWNTATTIGLEDIRKQLRELMHLIDKESRKPVYTDFEDEFSGITDHEEFNRPPQVNVDRYRRRIRKFIEEHGNHLVIQKIRNAKPLTDTDVETLQQFLMESDPVIRADEFREIVGEEIDLIKFVRSVSGLSRETVIREFEEFLSDNRLSSNQIQFIEQMIEFYTQKGHLEIGTLYEPPFDFLDQDGIDGVFRDRTNIIDLLIEKVEKLNEVRVG